MYGLFAAMPLDAMAKQVVFYARVISNSDEPSGKYSVEYRGIHMHSGRESERAMLRLRTVNACFRDSSAYDTYTCT